MGTNSKNQLFIYVEASFKRRYEISNVYLILPSNEVLISSVPSIMFLSARPCCINFGPYQWWQTRVIVFIFYSNRV